MLFHTLWVASCVWNEISYIVWNALSYIVSRILRAKWDIIHYVKCSFILCESHPACEMRYDTLFKRLHVCILTFHFTTCIMTSANTHRRMPKRLHTGIPCIIFDVIHVTYTCMNQLHVSYLMWYMLHTHAWIKYMYRMWCVTWYIHMHESTWYSPYSSRRGPPFAAVCDMINDILHVC